MEKKSVFRLFWAALLCSSVLWASTALGKLYPPCRAIFYTLNTADSITYRVTDPISLQNVEETWQLTQGDERYIESVKDDQGILTWVARYRNTGEPYFTYQVHFRIYDPGRGSWRSGFWGPFGGYNPVLNQHQVKDGVVAWTAHRFLGAGPADKKEHQVLLATYDPKLGSWPVGHEIWQVDRTSWYSPEVLRVKNGVVAWPMNNALTGKASDEASVDVVFEIYDQEINRWVGSLWHFGAQCDSFDWIEILGDSTEVLVMFSHWYCFVPKFSLTYDLTAHKWLQGGLNDRRALFVAAPTTGTVPFRVWFWDCSVALDGATTPSMWGWDFGQGFTWGTRSPSYLYSVPGQHEVSELIYYFTENDYIPYPATTRVNAQAPLPPPVPPQDPISGSISINNGAAYTNSIQVTLGLGYSGSAREMCFKGPGMLGWTMWEPVAAGREWVLSTWHIIGGTPDGPQTVRVKFRDQVGTESPEYQASIILDLTPPTGALTLNNGALSTNNPNVLADWSAADTYPMKMTYTAFNEGEGYSFWSWAEDYQPTSMTIPFNSTGGKKTVIVRFTDQAGNSAQIQEQIGFIPPLYLPLILRN